MIGLDEPNFTYEDMAFVLRSVKWSRGLLIRFPLPAAMLYGILCGCFAVSMFDRFRPESLSLESWGIIFTVYGLLGGAARYTNLIFYRRRLAEAEQLSNQAGSEL